MTIIKITDKENPISTNFTYHEFFIAGKTKNSYDIYQPLVYGAQIIREWINKPCKITSTYRPNDTYGHHRYNPCAAMDCNSVSDKLDTLTKFKQECLNYIKDGKSDLVQKLRSVGIGGFGIEGVCIHIDTRLVGTRRDEYGTYTVFEYKQHVKNGRVIIDINRAL